MIFYREVSEEILYGDDFSSLWNEAKFFLRLRIVYLWLCNYWLSVRTAEIPILIQDVTQNLNWSIPLVKYHGMKGSIFFNQT